MAVHSVRDTAHTFTAYGSSRYKRPLAGRSNRTNIYCLHDTHLKPFHVPVDLLPVYRPGERRTSWCCHCRHLHSSLQQFIKFSRDERPGGSVPAFAWSDVACRLGSRPSSSGATPILPITGKLLLFPPSHTRRPIRVPCGSLSISRGLRAYPVPCK